MKQAEKNEIEQIQEEERTKQRLAAIQEAKKQASERITDVKEAEQKEIERIQVEEENLARLTAIDKAKRQATERMIEVK